EALDERIGQAASVIRGWPIGDVRPRGRKLAAEIAEEADALASHDVQLDLGAFRLETLHQEARFLYQIRIERAGETTIGREQQNCRALRVCRLPEQRELLGKIRRVQVGNNVRERPCVRP